MIDGLRAGRKWEEVKKQQKQYAKNLKQGKVFKSKFGTKEEQTAYIETVELVSVDFINR